MCENKQSKSNSAPVKTIAITAFYVDDSVVSDAFKKLASLGDIFIIENDDVHTTFVPIVPFRIETVHKVYPHITRMKLHSIPFTSATYRRTASTPFLTSQNRCYNVPVKRILTLEGQPIAELHQEVDVVFDFDLINMPDKVECASYESEVIPFTWDGVDYLKYNNIISAFFVAGLAMKNCDRDVVFEVYHSFQYDVKEEYVDKSQSPLYTASIAQLTDNNVVILKQLHPYAKRQYIAAMLAKKDVTINETEFSELMKSMTKHKGRPAAVSIEHHHVRALMQMYHHYLSDEPVLALIKAREVLGWLAMFLNDSGIRRIASASPNNAQKSQLLVSAWIDRHSPLPWFDFSELIAELQQSIWMHEADRDLPAEATEHQSHIIHYKSK